MPTSVFSVDKDGGSFLKDISPALFVQGWKLKSDNGAWLGNNDCIFHFILATVLNPFHHSSTYNSI